MAESWPLARLQVLNNSGRMFMFRVKTLSARDCKFATDEIQDNKFNGDSLESAAKMAKGLQRVSAPCWS